MAGGPVTPWPWRFGCEVGAGGWRAWKGAGTARGRPFSRPFSLRLLQGEPGPPGSAGIPGTVGLQVGGGRGWTGVKMQDGGPLDGSGMQGVLHNTHSGNPAGPASARLLIPGDWPCPIQGLSEMEGFREEPGPSGPLSGSQGCAGLGAVSPDPASPALSPQGPRGLRGLPGPLGPPGDRVSLPAPTRPQLGGL